MTTTLREAFVEDHQTLMRGLSRLIALLEDQRDEEASRLARELDAAVGPHMEFEETVFYPEVSKLRGRDYVDNLFREHELGLSAVRTLSARGPGSVLGADERPRLLEQLRAALDHAVSCGTLLSHVTSLPEAEQQKLLAELERCRRRSRRWTELHPGD